MAQTTFLARFAKEIRPRIPKFMSGGCQFPKVAMDSGVCTVLCAVRTVLRCTLTGNAVELLILQPVLS